MFTMCLSLFRCLCFLFAYLLGCALHYKSISVAYIEINPNCPQGVKPSPI